jgi:hypothetical protein
MRVSGLFLKTFVAIFFWFSLLGRANASEVFLYLGFEDNARVFRVVTDYEFHRPIGYLFDAEPAEAFYIDNYKDFRMLRLDTDNEYEPANESLFRQVYDGPIKSLATSDKVFQHQDQREKLVEGSLAKPVYRTTGLPFSCGTGRKLNLRIKESYFADGELEVLPGKNWYQIPNGSWYQTWLTEGGAKDADHLVFYDQWRKQKVRVIESFWRGEKPGKVVERTVHENLHCCLFRAVVNSRMKIGDSCKKPYIAATRNEKFTCFFKPGNFVQRGELLIYSWFDTESGRVSLRGQVKNLPVLLESKDKNKRFAGLVKDGVIVVGPDIVQQWLKEVGSGAVADCTLVAFHQLPLSATIKVAVYSRENAKLYLFELDHSTLKPKRNFKSIGVDLQIDTLFYDQGGNLLLACNEEDNPQLFADLEPGYGIETLHFDVSEELGEFSEDAGRFVNTRIPEKLTGSLVFSKSYKESVYALNENNDEFTLLNSVDLSKEYFCRRFELNDPPQNLLEMGYAEIIDLAGKPGNFLGEMDPEVPGFPDQYEKPKRVFIGFYQE